MRMSPSRSDSEELVVGMFYVVHRSAVSEVRRGSAIIFFEGIVRRVS